MSNLPKMRTIEGLYQEMLLVDPSSQISRNFIRSLVVSGRVKSTMAGSKYLINMDDFMEYLLKPTQNEDSEDENQNESMRKVKA